MLHALIFYVIIGFIRLVFANVEKTIFVAPEASSRLASLPGKIIGTITPQDPTLQTRLSVTFPSLETPRGQEHWVLLDRLSPGARYEIRICWAAISPTDFWLETFTKEEVIKTKSVNSVIAQNQPQEPEGDTSFLYMRIDAAASYYTNNATLMQYPERVLVDIILDHFLLGILPGSLLPVGCLIVVTAVAAWFLGISISRRISSLAQASTKDKTI